MLDSGARGSTTTFAERGIGDVLLAWENEAFLALKELGPDKFEIVVPVAVSILAEPPVAVVDKVVDKQGHARGGRGLPGVPVHARRPGDRRASNYYRPRRRRRWRPSTPSSSPRSTLFTIDEVFGGWAKAQKTHFADGGVFDQIYQPANADGRCQADSARASTRASRRSRRATHDAAALTVA